MNDDIIVLQGLSLCMSSGLCESSNKIKSCSISSKYPKKHPWEERSRQVTAYIYVLIASFIWLLDFKQSNLEQRS